ncbi:dynein heavy chain, putative, partial [Bodo saltans]
KSDALNEIRALKAPPEPIRDVLEGVLALLGISDVSWQSMRKFLGERGAKERILEFDARQVTPAIRDNVSKLLDQKKSSFKQETIMRASTAAAPMAAWVKANVDYATILERIGPLQGQLDSLVTNKQVGEEKLEKLRKKLKKIDERVEQLRKDFSQKCKEAERLKDKLEKAEKDLGAAEDLLEKLSGEKTRSVAAFMRTESELLQYKTEGLPSDELSQENAVVILDTTLTPLVVDPANQAAQWLKAHLKSHDVTVETTSLHDDRFAHTLELAIRFGKTLLVTEVDRVDPMLFPVLRRDLISQGPKRVVTLGNKLVDWQDTFRLFLFTRSTDLRLSPDSSSLVVEVNFSVTRQGLESQLLGNTIQHEKPELETLKVELLQKEEQLKLQLAKLEESLLADLANSHGNLLENAQLVQSLNLIKSQASTIAESLEQSSKLQLELDAKREVYRDFAHKGSVMFFLIQDMELRNHMYQFSLEDFLQIFEDTLRSYQGDQDLDYKIPALSLSLAQQSFLHVSRGLFKQDRIEFAMHIAHGYFPGEFPEAHWRVFIGGGEPGDVDGAARRLPPWAPVNAKVILASLLAAEPGAVERLQLQNQQFWESWARTATPEKDIGQFGALDRLLLVAMFRPDRLAATMSDVALSLLKLNALVEVTSIENLVQRSRARDPILLITSTGADPSIEVQDAAYKIVGRARFTQIALGGGQTDEAMIQLRRCAASGEWLFLKNLHLVLGWVSALENEISSMAAPHKDFRLFLTTEAHDLFPSVLLKSCVKMSVESPPGVKQNLLRTYSTWDDEFLAQRSVAQSQILFGLAWFHALVQERRTYIPQGWVKHYDFTQADMKSAADIIKVMVDSNGNADWTAIRGLLESAIYGGRLDNTQDIKVLVVLLEKVFDPDTLIAKRTPLYQSIFFFWCAGHQSQLRHFQHDHELPPRRRRACPVLPP